jgi:hypothetical protein
VSAVREVGSAQILVALASHFLSRRNIQHHDLLSTVLASFVHYYERRIFPLRSVANGELPDVLVHLHADRPMKMARIRVSAG